MSKKRSRKNETNSQINSQTQKERSKIKLQVQHIINEVKIEYKTETQKRLWELIDKNQITLCAGPAGTGKSFISIAKALSLLYKTENKYNKIIICKPVIEADEKLGYLPGSVEEKLDPYIYSSKYIIQKIIGESQLNSLIDNKLIEFKALAYMRGINIDNSILIAEEMQNTTPRQMKTLLTRIGENSKFILSGDFEQSDRYKNYKDTGLFFSMEKLQGIDDIGLLEFNSKDIIRNPIITKILDKFNGDV